MTQDETQQLLDQASSFYNDGQYDDAIALWNRVLAAEPQNPRALEGIKMANLLLSDWVQPATPADSIPQKVANQVPPSDAGFVEEQLALARHYTMLGDGGEAAAACRRVLEVDGGNEVAAEILASLGADAGAAPDLAIASLRSLEPITTVGSRAPVVPPDEAELALDPLSVDLGEEAGSLPWESPPAPRAEEGPEGRIASLLEEGDRFEQTGRFQDAIDTWSRIFVLQDAHAEAEQRMDRARRALEQQARRMEEHLTRGDELASAGRLPEALDAFRRVLEIRSEHAEARRRIAEIEATVAAGPAAPAARVPEFSPPAPPPYVPIDNEAPPAPSALPTPPPLPSREARAVRPSAVSTRSWGPLAAAAVGGVAVLAIGGYFAWQTLFPAAPVAVAPAAGAAGAGGESPANTAPAEAAPVAPLSVQEVTPSNGSAPAPAVIAAPQAKADAKEAIRLGIARFRAGEYKEAKAQFDEVLRLDPSHFEATEWAAKSQVEIDKRGRYAGEIAAIQLAFAQRDYRGALYKLYRVESPTAAEQKKVELWIGDCWYDWGVESLQGGRLEDAQKNFQEARGARANDREAAQHLEVLARYKGRAADAALQAYAARLTLRPLD